MNGLREKINEMSRKYSEFIMTKETDDSKIEELQVSVEEGEKKLAIIREELGKLKKNTSKALAEYAEHKDKIKEIKEQLDDIQPNTFNKGTRTCFINNSESSK
jgi:predicted nuclease with TOPRIM domain